MFSFLYRLAELFMSNPWIYFGLGPSLAAIFGYSCTALFCEWIIKQPFARKYLLVYSESEKADRLKDLEETRSKVSLITQAKDSFWHVAGPTNLIAVVFTRLFFPYIMRDDSVLPSFPSFLAQFFLLAVWADLGLYWGHRIQHEIPYLWNHYHSVHHTLKTPR